MASPQDLGTSLGVAKSATVTVYLTDLNNNYVYVTCAGTPTIPSSVAGYAIGCILIDNVNAGLYVNTGTVASCTFTGVTIP